MPNNKIPNIRFKGFDQEWEEAAISSKASFSKGKGYSKADIEQTGEPLLLYGSLYTDYKTNINDVTTFAKKKESSVVSTGKEVVVPASGETAEDIARASAIHKDGIILGGDLNVITADDSVDKSYLALELTYGKSHNKLVKKAQGISVVHLHNSDIQELDILFPDPAEQQKIGTFFATLDDLIAAKEQELEKLRQLKAALLQQMFPSDENDNTNRGGYNDLIVNQLDKLNMTISTTPNTPRIRFKGFTEPWERKDIGDVATMYSGGTPSTSQKEYYGGNIPFIRSGEIHNDKTELFISDLGLQQSSAKMVSKGDILMAIYGTTSGEIDICQINGAINQAILCIQTKGDKYFFKFSWERNVNRVIDLYLQGAQGNLSAQLVKQVDMLFPDFAEQQKIGNFFREQDEVICASADNITKLKTIKQALLQKMFAA